LQLQTTQRQRSAPQNKHQENTLVCGFSSFFNDTATTEIYTLSLHDALPIYDRALLEGGASIGFPVSRRTSLSARSEGHTSELQSHHDLVCRLLLVIKIA